MSRIAIVSAVLLAAACASPPEEIGTTYVSPSDYEPYDCKRLSQEADHVSRRLQDVYVNLKKTADDDTAQVGVGFLFFVPTLLFVEGGDGPDAAEFARLKGEHDAIREVSEAKQCGIRFDPVIPVPARKQKADKMQVETVPASRDRRY